MGKLTEQAQQMIAEKETELIVAGSSITCGCSGLDDILTFDRDCKNVILYLEKLKKSISTKTTLHKFEASITAIGQIKIGDVCIDKVYIHTQESPSFEVSLSSKKKTTMGVEFDINNSTNKYKIDIQDTEAKDVKIDAVWKYLGGKVPEHQATFPITGAQLREIFSGTSQERCDEVASIINKYSDKFEINTPLRMAHFLGQIGVESANLNAMGNKSGENPCYKKTNNAWTYNSGRGQGWIAKKKWSETPIMEGCDDFTEDLKGKRKHPNWNSIDDVPKKFVCSTENPSSISGKNLLSYVYRCEGGNGDEASGDGYRYRGHGVMQITWKKQYIAFNDWLVESGFTNDYKGVLTDPDEGFKDKEIDILSAMWYWDKESINDVADRVKKESNLESFKKVTLKINKQALANEERNDIFKTSLDILEK